MQSRNKYFLGILNYFFVTEWLSALKSDYIFYCLKEAPKQAPSENASQSGSNSTSSTPAPANSTASPSHTSTAQPKSTSSHVPQQQSQTAYPAYNQGRLM